MWTGRSDFYGPEFGQKYIDILNVKYDWEQTLTWLSAAVNTIVMPTDAPLTGAVKESRNWRVIYDDTRTIVFRSAKEAGGNAQQVSTSCTGGEGGRGLAITASSNVHPEEHVSKAEGASKQ